MKKTTLPNNRWLPLALIPLMSVAVLAGCSSDDDDDDPVAPVGVIDSNGNDLPDAAEAEFTLGDDVNGDGIDDNYAQPADSEVVPADTNENGIDDSFEVSLTLGDDANSDGIDDAAAAALAANLGTVTPTPAEPDGNGNGVPDAVESEFTLGADANGDGIDDDYAQPVDPEATPADTNQNGVDDSFEAELTLGDDTNSDGIDDAAAAALAASNNPGNGGGGESGTAGELTIGNNQGSANFDFDGSNLSGTVTLDDSVSASSVWLQTGIAAADRLPGNPAVQLEGSGSDFEIPVTLSADQTSQISDNLNSGNLFILVNTTDGSTLRSNQILPIDNSVVATFTSLAPEDGQAILHFNAQSGAFTAAVSIAEALGSVSTVALHSGSSAGPVLVTLALEDRNVWTATGTMSADDLAQVTSNNAFFNGAAADGTSVLSGQVITP